ncbi:TRAP transporter small permease [Ammoniphilus resinae]|uniref:TRAP-type C4-dicarboxylate transport system permease small subunit n=1 Tax=Ammoniphilus resinae TaxID=861532 RepID=A0ABS4GX53_9BACL|nr:TRAP transporter small permease [Ammoniphilus resinae]MBP1934450.1 TRAP-type C4-dicarboxylate transport system permease small subunit [Ammoniphilus resinae]
MKILRWAWNYLEEFLGGICLAGIVIFVFLNVVLRYIFNAPVGWVSEISTILFVWMVMFGVGAAARHKLHPSIDFLVQMIPVKPRIILEVLMNIVMLYLLVDFSVRGWDFAWDLGWKKLTGMLQMHYTVVYLALPIGFGLMFIRVLGHIISDIKIVLSNDLAKLEERNKPNVEEAL